MSIIKFLKQIDSSNGIDKNGQPITYDLSDPENKVLKDLEKRGLIDYTPVYLKNSIGAAQCSVTKEGLEYIEKHKESTQRFIIQTLVSALVSVVTGVVITLVLVYVFHISK